jgi:hypothetical protein
MLGALWSVITLPFRILAWVVEVLGRLLGLVFGFALIVAGVAFLAGAFYILGIPIFLVGLLLMLRSLG